MCIRFRVSRAWFQIASFLLLLAGFLTTVSAIAQAHAAIPSGDIRVHYFRPDGNYAGWTVYAYGDTTEPNNFGAGPVQISGTDSFGVYFDVGVTSNAMNVGLVLHNGTVKDPGITEFVDPATQGSEYWQLAGSDALLTSQPPTGNDPPIPANHARIHYFRPDGNYNNWVLYVYGATTDPTGNFCGTNDEFTGYDSYGPYWDVGVVPGHLGFIIHNCSLNEKDPGPDQSLQIPQQIEGWVVSGDPYVFPQVPTAAQKLAGELGQLQAYWIDATTVAIQSQYSNSAWTYSLAASPTAGLQVAPTGLTGGTSIPLTPFAGSLTAEELAHYPQLASYALFKLPATLTPDRAKLDLKSQLAVSAVDSTGTLQYATSVQSFGAIDALTAYSGKLGVIFNHGGNDANWSDFADDASIPIKIKVWAPTAQSLSLLLFANGSDTVPEQTVAMHEHDGVWVARGAADWKGKFYQLQAKVLVPFDEAIDTNTTTDPYSLDLNLNGTMSRITDLDDSGTKPPYWDELPSPALGSLNDLSIYELHIRDFSVGDNSVPALFQGTYEAFTDPFSNGMKHLHTLSQSGLKAVHLLPSFHFGSVDENKSNWQSTGRLTQYPPDGQQQQQAVEKVQAKDAYNWGYDPVHYMAPAGQYALNPYDRVIEYRSMVEGLHYTGVRVIQDVVFNHTYTFGEDPRANFDELVPNYYHRLSLLLPQKRSRNSSRSATAAACFAWLRLKKYRQISAS